MTIYDDIGGADAIAAVVEDFYQRVLADDHLAPWFEGLDVRRLRAHQRAFVAVALGGPDTYAGRSMADAHAALAITPAAFTAVLTHLTAALTHAQVPPTTIATITTTLRPLKPQIITAPD